MAPINIIGIHFTVERIGKGIQIVDLVKIHAHQLVVIVEFLNQRADYCANGDSA